MHLYLPGGGKAAIQILLVHPILQISDPQTPNPIIRNRLRLSRRRRGVLLRLLRRNRGRLSLRLLIVVPGGRRLLRRRNLVLRLLRHPLLRRLLRCLLLVLRRWGHGRGDHRASRLHHRRSRRINRGGGER